MPNPRLGERAAQAAARISNLANQSTGLADEHYLTGDDCELIDLRLLVDFVALLTAFPLSNSDQAQASWLIEMDAFIDPRGRADAWTRVHRHAPASWAQITARLADAVILILDADGYLKRDQPEDCGDRLQQAVTILEALSPEAEGLRHAYASHAYAGGN